MAGALKKIKAKTLSIGITTDMLFPLREQQYLGDAIPGAVFKAIHSPYGHDGFLLEYASIESIIREWQGERPQPPATGKNILSSLNLLL